MKKLLSTTALVLTLAFSNAAMADSPTVSQSYIDHAISKLPADEAQDFRDALNDAHEQNRDLYEQIHELHGELHDILVADTFDADAFQEKSAELRNLHDKIGANIDQAFATAASELTPAQRMSLAKALENTQIAKHVAAKKAVTPAQ